jgi:PRC-barrel domain
MLMKKLALISAVSVFAMGTALAQSPNPPASTTTPSATEVPKSDSAAPKSDMTAPKAESTAPKDNPTASTSSMDGAKFVASQKPEQFLATKFKGTDVVGADNQKVGDVSDILFDKDGKIDAFVVSVGGFLGIGAKEVALAPSAFQFVPGDPNSATDKSPKLKISMDKEQLKQAANFEPYKEPSRATTGTGGTGGAPRPAPGGMSK